MTSISADISSTFRALSRSPGFSAFVVTIVALGIGGTTALFSLVDAVVLRDLPFKQPDRLVEVWGRDEKRTGMRVPGAILEALRERSTTVEAFAIHGPVAGVFRSSDGAVDVRGDRVSANFLDVMGVPSLAGRGFVPEDERPGSPAVVSISFSFWQKFLGGRPDTIGRTIYLNSVPYTVVGIMPPQFQTSFRGMRKEYWTPYISDQVRELERKVGYEVIARLAPGVTVDESGRELQAIAASVAADGWGAGARRLGMNRLKDEIIGDSAFGLQLLLVAMAIVLATACANLAQLLLARSEMRVAEFAIRKAIGAGSAQLFRLAIVENLILSTAGGLAGMLLARGLVPAMLTLAPSEIPRVFESKVDDRVLLAAVALTFLTGCAFGLAPALRLSRLAVGECIGNRSAHVKRRKVRFTSVLVVTQVAVSAIFAAMAALIGQTFLTLLPSNPGFAVEERTAFVLPLRPDLLTKAADRSSRLDELARRLKSVPGITDVALASNIPFSGDYLNSPVSSIDDVGGSSEAALLADVRAASANLFQVLGMRILRGRTFGSADGPQSPGVAIVNETLARRLGDTDRIIGRRLRVLGPAALRNYEIVGVVADSRSLATSVDVLNEVYIPYAQSKTSIAYLVIHSALDTGTIATAIRSAIRSVLPELPLRSDDTAIALAGLVSRSLAGPRFSATLITCLFATAVILAVIGVFALVANSISQRRKELAIRAALGARPSALVIETTRAVIQLTVLGIALGLAGGAYLTRFLKTQLYAVEPLDLPTFAGAATVTLVAAGLAAYLASRQAVRVDMSATLRSQ